MSFVYSFSSLDLYQTCPQLFKYKYEDKVEYDDNTLPARYGTWMIHWPITNWYSVNGKFRPSFDQLWEQVNATDEELSNKKWKCYSIKTARFLWEEYVNRFGRDFEQYNVVSVEEYKVVGDYGSKADIVFRRKSDEGIVTHDIKSSRWNAPLDGTHVNNQFLGQMWVWGTLEGMVTVSNPETLTVERKPIKVTEAEIKRWLWDTDHRKKTIERSRRLDAWPRNAPKSCNQFGRPCAAKTVCWGE